MTGVSASNFESSIPDSYVSDGNVRVRMYNADIKGDRAVLCFVSEKKHYVTYSGKPGAWREVVPSSFFLPPNHLDQVFETLAAKGKAFVENGLQAVAMLRGHLSESDLRELENWYVEES